ncbi:Tr-type G domain-containing protein [Heracleum sosnowskyi]|uniref:Translation initiation factor IF-2, chloroplastic n=1 Tax=Heracleum sosnowskyi TaxID=360622 RepID=A0AAD8H6Y6_9APIA|nr:Tr-type G domain-containing protein [Heracleum sosnowskyi]
MLSSVNLSCIASLASFGTVSTCSSTPFEESLSFVSRVSLARNFSSLRNLRFEKKWRYVCLCKCSITTEDIADQGTSVALDSTFRGSNEDKSNLILKPTPRHLLKPSGKWDPLRPSGENDKLEGEERNKVIESLGEVLEKAEKLETRKKAVTPAEKPPTSSTGTKQRNGAPDTPSPFKKTKTLKSVWRKGNPVATIQKEVKKQPKKFNVDKGDLSTITVEKVEFLQPPAPLRPPAALNPVIKRPVILIDVGAATKSLATGTTSAAKAKEHQPILIDKFASKKAEVDPLIARSVLAPRKHGKASAPRRSEDDFCRKSGPSGGSLRRMAKNDILDEEASELDVSIRGAITARKGRKWSKASRKAARLQAARDAKPVKAEIFEVAEDGMLIEELAYNLATSEGEIFKFLYSKGIKPDGVQTLDKDIVKMVCKEYDVEVIDAAPFRLEEMAKKKEIFDEENWDKLEDKPPVLTIMGHVDHGKTTLLDHIRKTKVAASEAGGITQGIGAYKVQVPIDGEFRTCVFLDTPGHEAFGAMRARGARVTDIAIIVVAADDGMRPQTNEAIAHAKAAGVPIVVAINKIDKDGAKPEQVMQELSSIGLMPEDWGGDIPMVQISALKGENVDDLLEIVMLVAELQELKANPHGNAKGTVIEAGLDKSKGPVATFIVQKGTLKKGDIIVSGEAFGKVRALFDDDGKLVSEAGPSLPIQVIGLNNVPFAGDEFEVVCTLNIARERAESRADSIRLERISAKAGDGKVTLSSFASAVSSRTHSGLDLHQLVIIMKVDLQGSIEAIIQALQVLPQDNVTMKFLLQATGDVSKSDIDLAVASKAIVFGFNVRASGSVKSYAENKGVEIRLYKVIYELVDDVRTAMEGLLDTVEDQIPIGSVVVRAVFSGGSGRFAGCMVTEGKVVKDCGIRVVRKGKTVFVGVLNSLRRIKEAVKEASAGLECGIGIDNFADWEAGDTLEAFNTVQKHQTLEEASATIVAALEEVGIKR